MFNTIIQSVLEYKYGKMGLYDWTPAENPGTRNPKGLQVVPDNGLPLLSKFQAVYKENANKLAIYFLKRIKNRS